MGGRSCCQRCGQIFLPPSREGRFRCPRCGHVFAGQGTVPPAPATPRRGKGRREIRVLVLTLLAVAVVIGGLTVKARLSPLERQREREAVRSRRMMVDAYHSPIESEHQGTESPVSVADREEWLAVETALRDAWEGAAAGLPDPTMLEGERTFEGFLRREARRMSVERELARAQPPEVARAVRLARRALERANTPGSAYSASETLGRALMMLGKHDEAIRVLRPLLPIDYPPRPALLLRRAYRHRGLSPNAADVRLWLGNPYAFDEVEAQKSRYLEESLRANEAWGGRFSRDAAQQLRVGWLCYDLAQARAAEEPGFPSPGPHYGRRVSAYVAEQYPDLIDRGIARCRQAEQLARGDDSLRCGALAGVGRGYLMRRRFDDAIRTLGAALQLDTNPQAAEDLRQARLRLTDPPG